MNFDSTQDFFHLLFVKILLFFLHLCAFMAYQLDVTLFLHSEVICKLGSRTRHIFVNLIEFSEQLFSCKKILRFFFRIFIVSNHFFELKSDVFFLLLIYDERRSLRLFVLAIFHIHLDVIFLCLDVILFFIGNVFPEIK